MKREIKRDPIGDKKDFIEVEEKKTKWKIYAKKNTMAIKRRKGKKNERDKVSITKNGVGTRHSQHKSKHIQFQSHSNIH